MGNVKKSNGYIRAQKNILRVNNLERGVQVY
jgi:hypothetical protein